MGITIISGYIVASGHEIALIAILALKAVLRPTNAVHALIPVRVVEPSHAALPANGMR
jgi:hypothetical protein